MAAGLAQEELQRVGRGLLDRGRGGWWRRLLFLRLLDDDLDPATVELAVEGVLLQRVELVCLEDVGELGCLQRPGLLGDVQELKELVVPEQVVDVDGRHGGKRTSTRELLGTKPPAPNQMRCSSTARSSPTRSTIAFALSTSSSSKTRSSP